MAETSGAEELFDVDVQVSEQLRVLPLARVAERASAAGKRSGRLWGLVSGAAVVALVTTGLILQGGGSERSLAPAGPAPEAKPAAVPAPTGPPLAVERPVVAAAAPVAAATGPAGVQAGERKPARRKVIRIATAAAGGTMAAAGKAAGSRPETAARPPDRAAEPPAPAPVPAPPVLAVTAPVPAVASPPPPTATKTLAPATVQRAVARQTAAFDRCVQSALAEPGGAGQVGRKIALLVAVGNGGLVEASEVEEPDVERSPLGACLRQAAGWLLFPPFEGEAIGLRIPLQLGVAAPGAAPVR
jgi:hypothetical protein